MKTICVARPNADPYHKKSSAAVHRGRDGGFSLSSIPTQEALVQTSTGSVDHIPFHDPKTSALADILCECQGAAPARLLVVGCGTGIEAVVLAQRLGAVVTGIDIAPNFDDHAASLVDLRRGDATQMEFDDESFDFVYSFHVLEHIPDYRKALREIHRVLKPGSGYMIGTPNRDRVIAYLGSRNIRLADKFRWNMADWKAMLRGRFRNECGAHAGYSSGELHEELNRIFTFVENITTRYYLQIYSRKRLLVSALSCTGISRWLFPAVYFYGSR
jgi:SAM-dependent methyltransferase